MKFDFRRGAKFGAISAGFFALVTPINNLLREEPIVWKKVIVGSIFVLLLFGLIGAFTDKLGSEVGDA